MLLQTRLSTSPKSRVVFAVRYPHPPTTPMSCRSHAAPPRKLLWSSTVPPPSLHLRTVLRHEVRKLPILEETWPPMTYTSPHRMIVLLGSCWGLWVFQPSGINVIHTKVAGAGQNDFVEWQFLRKRKEFQHCDTASFILDRAWTNKKFLTSICIQPPAFLTDPKPTHVNSNDNHNHIDTNYRGWGAELLTCSLKCGWLSDCSGWTNTKTEAKHILKDVKWMAKIATSEIVQWSASQISRVHA